MAVGVHGLDHGCNATERSHLRPASRREDRRAVHTATDVLPLSNPIQARTSSTAAATNTVDWLPRARHPCSAATLGVAHLKAHRGPRHSRLTRVIDDEHAHYKWVLFANDDATIIDSKIRKEAVLVGRRELQVDSVCNCCSLTVKCRIKLLLRPWAKVADGPQSNINLPGPESIVGCQLAITIDITPTASVAPIAHLACRHQLAAHVTAPTELRNWGCGRLVQAAAGGLNIGVPTSSDDGHIRRSHLSWGVAHQLDDGAA